ncbi:hypothetical protein BC826DRAFT_1120336 [Russula brevipes]|nr:hypothetical protein BC826DRAFT_1120336 [Russula brevipes]
MGCRLLARLFGTLGIVDGEDAEFWKSSVNWGHIGAEFTPRPENGRRSCARWALLIFCTLGHLATTVVPLDGSGLGEGYREDPRRPLTHASETVWAELGQLRNQVSDLYSNHTSEDYLHHLLGMIDYVRSSYAPVSKEYNPSENAEAHGSNTLVLLPREPRRGSQRFSSGSMSTLVTGGWFGSSPKREDSFGEHSADAVFDLGMNPQARWTSLHDDDAGSYHLPSHYNSMQGIPGEVLDRSTSTVPSGIQPVNTYSPSFADAGQRLMPTYPPTTRSGSGRSAGRPKLATVQALVHYRPRVETLLQFP